jgi:hypothetical protein
MPIVVYAECHKLVPYVECNFGECHYGECRYAECRGAQLKPIFSEETFIFIGAG